MKHYAPNICLTLKTTLQMMIFLFNPSWGISMSEKGDNSFKYLQNFAKS